MDQPARTADQVREIIAAQIGPTTADDAMEATEDDAVDVLSSAFHAAAGEYGA